MKPTNQPTDHFSATGSTLPGDQPLVYRDKQGVRLDRELAIANRCVSLDNHSPATDAYKVLRTQILQRTRPRGWNTIMVTSARPREGKTVTAINLAVTFAKEFNQTALLVDCDLKNQCIAESLGLASGLGLVDYLLYDQPMQDLIVWPGIDKLTIISGGRTIQDSTELLGSPRMEALVQEMKTRYDDRYVFFDVPPLLDVADAIAFAPMVDGILMVVEAGKTAARDINAAAKLIPEEKFLGFVLNRQG
jgi:protein-tyrosine kinase